MYLRARCGSAALLYPALPPPSADANPPDVVPREPVGPIVSAVPIPDVGASSGVRGAVLIMVPFALVTALLSGVDVTGVRNGPAAWIAPAKFGGGAPPPDVPVGVEVTGLGDDAGMPAKIWSKLKPVLLGCCACQSGVNVCGTR